MDFVTQTPKNRYRIPRRTAESRHRFRHICAMVVSERSKIAQYTLLATPVQRIAAETAECRTKAQSWKLSGS